MRRWLAVSMLAVSAALASPASAVEADVWAPAHAEAPATVSRLARAMQEGLAQSEDAGDPVEKAVLAGLEAFYAGRNFAPLWLTDAPLPPQVTALGASLRAAETFGLDPALYATQPMAAAYADDASRAEAELGFSRAVARFVTHLASGRLRPADISRIITLEPERPDVAEALLKLASAPDVALALGAYEPPHPQYIALKAELAALRSRPDDPAEIVVPEGKLLKPGMRDPRVPLLRLRLAVPLEVRAEPELYDAALVVAVEAFQAGAGLTADGILGPRTLVAMQGVSRADDIASIVANLERWRWSPRELGGLHVMVNVPEFVVRVVESDSVVHQTRVVVGKPNQPTPTFSHVMSHLVVNPFWNVPVSIVSNEMLPEIRRDPYGYFARHGYQVLARSGGRMRVVDPWSVDWYSVQPSAVAIRQVPGDRNALGRIKFMFPNQHSVYLHDTPSKKLFQKDYRAFSHGCVRVEEPLAFADAILPRAAPEWDSRRLQKLYGGKERRVNLDHPVPVHLAYFTRWIGADGTLRRFDDIYGYDEEMRALSGV